MQKILTYLLVGSILLSAIVAVTSPRVYYVELNSGEENTTRVNSSEIPNETREKIASSNSSRIQFEDRPPLPDRFTTSIDGERVSGAVVTRPHPLASLLLYSNLLISGVIISLLFIQSSPREDRDNERSGIKRADEASEWKYVVSDEEDN